MALASSNWALGWYARLLWLGSLAFFSSRKRKKPTPFWDHTSREARAWERALRSSRWLFAEFNGCAHVHRHFLNIGPNLILYRSPQTDIWPNLVLQTCRCLRLDPNASKAIHSRRNFHLGPRHQGTSPSKFADSSKVVLNVALDDAFKIKTGLRC